MPSLDSQYYLRRQEESIANMENRIGSQKRILNLRDDPLAASHAVRYDSYLSRLERYEKNSLYAKDHYNEVDAYLRQTNDILQRVREIAVQGANGIYSREDLGYMATEVNELLKELVSLANALGADGKQLFSGDKVDTEPFRIVAGAVQGADASPDQNPMVVQVEYQGAGPGRRTEISEGNYADLDLGGGDAFWSEKMQIFSPLNGAGYLARTEQSFYLDGQEIHIAPGDSIYAVVDKINDSTAPVRAYVDPDTQGLVLEGTNPHLIRAEDAGDGAVLQDLGIIRNNNAGISDWNPDATVSGGSLFDKVIELRDALFRGDTGLVGSQGIGGMDSALTNIQARLALNGSRQERAEMTWARLNQEIPHVAAALSRESGLDLVSAATDLALMKTAHQAALQVASKLLPQSLLDFLR
jgi:flagellar hook-associated protein 3 FlgL